MPSIIVTPEIEAALAYGPRAVVAVGVSGGKDSCAVALATHAHLQSIAFAGEMVLIHSDLGKTEWQESLPKCQELANHLGVELIVVRRRAGGMLERWQGRWANNVSRYVNLECVKLILPWSTASMRFCTSELKTGPICAALKKRFNGKMIVNVVGIRREESPGRAKAVPSKPNPGLRHKTACKITEMATCGYDWNPILDWKVQDVFDCIATSGLELHEAYTKYGMSRVSCAYCILSNSSDLKAAATASQNHNLYREMVSLEIQSTFSFQSGKWLGDVAPHLLSESMRSQLRQSKILAEHRERIEATIPLDLLYVKGWPHRLPTPSEADLLASVRNRVGELISVPVKYTSRSSVIDRYAELLDEKARLSKAKNHEVYS